MHALVASQSSRWFGKMQDDVHQRVVALESELRELRASMGAKLDQLLGLVQQQRH